MKRYKIIAASGIFIALTAAKLLSPALASDLRREVVSVISRNDDYEKAAAALGEKLNLLGGDEPVEASGTTALVYEPTTIDELLEETISILPEKKEKPAPTPTPTPSPTPTPVPAAVTAFLESQKEFADYAVPADVSYEYPPLPFEYSSPVAGLTSSGFGYRLHPLLNEVKFHHGTDFAAQSGDDITAFADGTVITAEKSDSFGNYIVISHAGGYETLYAHCSKLYVSAGSTVKKGQKIALVGQTGNATGPHLHLELTCDGIYYNPEFYL